MFVSPLQKHGTPLDKYFCYAILIDIIHQQYMKLAELETKKIRVLHNIVAFKWIKTEKVGNFFVPDNIHGFNDQRLGHKYVCEAIACGPDAHDINPGDRFFLHEYGKLEQEKPWNKDDVMFCEAVEIHALLDKNFEGMMMAEPITEAMENYYGENEDVQVEFKQ